MNARVSQQSFPEEEPFLVAAVAEPKIRPLGIGVIVIGNGVADLMAARRFAALGCVAMQIRLIRDSDHHRDMHRRHETYDESGVSRCVRAMNHLARRYDVQRFILMGNCALANICFNTTLTDPRVAGLILTNPYVSDPVTRAFWFKLRRHLFHRGSWLRLLRGNMRMPGRTAAAAQPRERTGGNALAPAWNYRKDLLLPRDFDRCLEGLLTGRALRCLIVFSHGEPGLDYFRWYYRRTLERLAAAGRFQLEVLPIEVHDFSALESAAFALNDLISAWAAKHVSSGHMTADASRR